MNFFDGEGKKKPRWQCFVCGELIEDYAEFCSHIIDNHEAGREYIKCPIDICGAPVRDLKSHFEVKHPKRPLPKDMQMKAIIWRDFTSTGKKIRTRKPEFQQGYHLSTKMAGLKLYYRSSYERAVYECLDKDNDIKAYWAEPFKVPYYYNNKWHDYIPDIRVEYADGITEIWEIKPDKQCDLAQNQAKWKFMEGYAEKAGWGFEVKTEHDIKDMQKKVKRQKSS